MGDVDMQGTGVSVEGKFIKLINCTPGKLFVYKYVTTATGKSGREQKHGYSIAVDPTVISLGTEVCVKGYGVRRADDIGSKIKVKHIDMFMNVSREEALEFGERKGVEVCKKVKKKKK